jgi:hypothetical protein
MKFNVKKINNLPEPNEYYISNKLQFDDGLITIITKDGSETFDYNSEGSININWGKTKNPVLEKVTLSEFPTLKIPRNEFDNFKVNNQFIVDKKQNHYILFQLILSKVDKELYLLPRREYNILVYSVFDSKKKYQGDFTLMDTGFGIAKCQINPQFNLDAQSLINGQLLRNYQNSYDQCWYAVYGPAENLKKATKQLEDYKKKIKKMETQFKDKWGYLF